MENQYTGVFEQVDGWWTGFAEELPGCNVQERTLDEARASLKETIQEILTANREQARREAEGHQVLRERVAVSRRVKRIDLIRHLVSNGLGSFARFAVGPRRFTLCWTDARSEPQRDQ